MHTWQWEVSLKAPVWLLALTQLQRPGLVLVCVPGSSTGRRAVSVKGLRWLVSANVNATG